MLIRHFFLSPAGARDRTRQRILSRADAEAGREMPAHGRPKPFVAVSDSEYAVARDTAERSD